MSVGLAVTAEPWMLLGERRRRTLEQRLRGAAVRWADEWASVVRTLSVTVESGSPPASVESGGRGGFGARKSSGEWLATVVCRCPVAAWAATGTTSDTAALLDPQSQPVAAALELRVLGAFWSALAPGTLATEAPLEPLEAQSLESATAALGRRSIRVAFGFGSGPAELIELRLCAALAAQLLAEPRARPVGGPLSSRRLAISQASMVVECHVGTVQVAVRDLHSLRPGDVLVTDTPLDGRAELRVAGKAQAIAVGTIADHEGRRALVVEELRRGLNR